MRGGKADAEPRELKLFWLSPRELKLFWLSAHELKLLRELAFRLSLEGRERGELRG